MPKLTIENFYKYQDEFRKSSKSGYRAKIIVHTGTCGIASGAETIYHAFKSEIQKRAVAGVVLSSSGCAGLCSREPMATIYFQNDQPVKYYELTEEKVREIFEKHVLNGEIVPEYALSVGEEPVC
ncbi:(2Fe-2S) ferredoxin domain-containing protein [candidate division KSB1 bacterium]|nr:(2Fe-2S) ferredoxin domain-containing protein [candidate division KSB1 bacterium]